MGRDINRHFKPEEEIVGDCERPVVRRLIDLIRLRIRQDAMLYSCDKLVQQRVPPQLGIVVHA